MFEERAQKAKDARRVPVESARPFAVLLGGIVTDEECNQVEFRTFLLLGDYRIEDVWDTVGLRRTGSNDIVVDDVFVPECGSLGFADTSRCVCFA